jgi:RND family efflux transporter MFP subunit
MRAASARRLSVAGCLLCLAASAGCGRKSAAGEDAGEAATAVAEVTLTRVTRADLTATMSISGTIAGLPNRDVRVSSLVAGRVAQVMVAEGDRVEQGQVLGKIDDRPFRDQLQQAEAAVARAKASLENARLSAARNQNLFERGIAARKDLEDARMQLGVAEADLRQAEAAQALTRLQLARTEVRSPVSGVVVKRFVSGGEQVDGTAAQPLVEVADIREVELLANVPATSIHSLHAGQTIPVSTGERNLTGHVVAISPAVDPATNAGLVRIRIANPQGVLRLGMFLTAQAPLERHTNALTVPPQAIYRNAQGQPQVYRVHGDVAEAVPVQVGIETPERTELMRGVSEGDTVILTGGYGLGSKTKVKVKS